MTICRHVRYTGRVQGVGFRYTAQWLAERFPVGGYVRNLPDGSVELVAQGEAEQVDAFLAAVAERMAGYIERTEVREETPGGYHGFRIRH
jgi:acylphosphatase